MSCDILLGRTNICKDSLGGLKFIYIMHYTRYNVSQIQLVGEQLFSFPVNDIYKYAIVGNSTFNESLSNENDGNRVTQSLSVTMPKISADMNYQLNRLVGGLVRAIVVDNNGNYNLLGLYNGLELKADIPRGTLKSDLSGYTLTFDGKEKVTAPFLNGLNGFNVKKDVIGYFEEGYIEDNYFEKV